MKRLESRQISVHRERCAGALCGDIIGELPAVAHAKSDGTYDVYHVMCAPARLRKAYHEMPGEPDGW